MMGIGVLHLQFEFKIADPTGSVGCVVKGPRSDWDGHIVGELFPSFEANAGMHWT